MALSKNSAAVAACSLFLLSCSHTRQVAQWDSPTPKGPEQKVIDVSTHTDFTGGVEQTSRIPLTREEYFKEMQENGVVGAVSQLSSAGKGYVDLHLQNVVHCAAAGAKINSSELESGLKSGKYGCIKIYLGYIFQYASDKNYEPAYRLAEKYDVPIVFHTGDTDNSKSKLKYADPLTIDEVAVEHPKVRFVIGHAGNPWIESAAEVAYKNPNVYLEGSGFLMGDLNRTPIEQINEYYVKPLSWIFGYLEDPTKLMFGSDFPHADMASVIAIYKRAIPQRYWQAVFHDNAARVFKLKKSGAAEAKSGAAELK